MRVWFDAHCHLDLPAFSADRAAVVARARAAGVGQWMMAGIEPAGFGAQRALAQAIPGVAWSAGLHPCWAHQVDLAAALSALPAAFRGPHAAVGLGELGLDYRKPYAPHAEAQQAAFRAQLGVARALDRPVVLHLVRAHGDALRTLRRDGLPAAGGMVHAFSGSAEVMREYVALGLHISFAGPVAHPRSRRLRAAAAAVPAHRLLVETDAPDQPLPGAGGRNEPAALAQVIEAVAAVRGEPARAVGDQAAQNARSLFRLETSPPG